MGAQPLFDPSQCIAHYWSVGQNACIHDMKSCVLLQVLYLLPSSAMNTAYEFLRLKDL